MRGDFAIGVEVRYIERESDPEARRFVFAYTITISNGGNTPAQLLERYWRITDGDGLVREVSGTGVVGRQPVIGIIVPHPADKGQVDHLLAHTSIHLKHIGK